MTRKRNYYKTISVHFTHEEKPIADDLMAEAEANQANSVADYAKSLILNHDTRGRIVLNADAERVRQSFQGKMDLLKEQIDDLQNRLFSSSQAVAEAKAVAQSLKGIDKPELSVAEQVKQQMDNFREEYKKEQQFLQLQARNKELEKLLEEKEKELEELQDEVDDLNDKNEDHQSQLGWLNVGKELAGPAFSVLTNKYPGIGETINNIAKGGLGAIGQGSTSQGQNLGEEEQRQFEFGKSFDMKFTIEERLKVNRILDFFYQHKDFIDQNISVLNQMQNRA